MPTDSIQLQIVKNGGAPATGAITAAFSDSIVLGLGSSGSGIKKVKYRIYEFPDGFALPSGWTTEAANCYSVTVQNGGDAPPITLPASGNDLRGKYFFDAVGNDKRVNGRVVGTLRSKAQLEIPFSSGLEDLGHGETNEFDSVRKYVRALKKLVRALDAAVLSGGGVTLHSLLSGLNNDDHGTGANAYDLAFRPLSAYTGAASTSVLADARKHITTSHGSANTLTIPPNASVAYAIGTLLMGVNIGAGAMTVTAGAGVTLNGSLAVAQWGWWWAKKVATDTWDVFVGGGGSSFIVSGTPAPGDVIKWNGSTQVWGGPDAFSITAFAASSATLEIGATATAPAFTAAENRTPTSLVLTNTDNGESKSVVGTPTSFTSSQNYTKTANNSTVSFTVTGSDGISSANRSTSIAWRPRVYWGTGAAGFTTEAQIEALAGSALQSSRAGSHAVNATGSLKVYWAAPASYGTPTFTVGGFSGGFTLVSSSISVTNANGVTQNYQLWESDSPGLGSITVVVT
jgi:hypothetical protein